MRPILFLPTEPRGLLDVELQLLLLPYEMRERAVDVVLQLLTQVL